MYTDLIWVTTKQVNVEEYMNNKRNVPKINSYFKYLQK